LALVGVSLRLAWERKGRDLAVSWREARERRALEAMARTPSPRVGRALKVLLPLVSLFIAVLVAEAGARVMFRGVRSSGDARNFFAAHGEPDRINSVGYRGPEVPARSDRYRIAVVGDSITWGVGLDEDQRYSNVLQKSLGPGYEVLNLGIPGHNMPEHLQTLGYALTLSPDFVVVQLYTNDFETPNMNRPRARPLLPWRPADRWLLRSSVIYTMLSAQWPRVQESIGVTESYQHYMFRYLGDPQSPESREGFGMLHEFIHRARAAKVGVGAVMFPNPEVMAGTYPYGYLHDRVGSVCAEEHIRCVDLRKPFLDHFTDVKEIVVSPFDGHPSARASAVAADELLAAFKSEWRTHVAQGFHLR
jgi:GDSL-like lipase/acylhydrolase family protein